MANYDKNTLVSEAPKITTNTRGIYQAEIRVYARTSSYQVNRLKGVELGQVEYEVKLNPLDNSYSLQTIVVNLEDYKSSDYSPIIEVDFNDDTSPEYRTTGLLGPKKKTKMILKGYDDPDRPKTPENNSVTKMNKSMGPQGLVEVRVEVYAYPSVSGAVRVFSNTEPDGSKTYSLHLQPDSNLGYARLQTYLIPTDWTSMSEYSDVTVVFNEG